jgi:hypothetical protein
MQNFSGYNNLLPVLTADRKQKPQVLKTIAAIDIFFNVNV